MKHSNPLLVYVEWYFNLQEIKRNGNPSVVFYFVAQKLRLGENSTGQIAWGMVGECFLWRRGMSTLKCHQQFKFLHLYHYFTLPLKGCRIMPAKKTPVVWSNGYFTKNTNLHPTHSTGRNPHLPSPSKVFIANYS